MNSISYFDYKFGPSIGIFLSLNHNKNQLGNCNALERSRSFLYPSMSFGDRTGAHTSTCMSYYQSTVVSYMAELGFQHIGIHRLNHSRLSSVHCWSNHLGCNCICIPRHSRRNLFRILLANSHNRKDQNSSRSQLDKIKACKYIHILLGLLY